jgi:hypothetical protein
MSLSLTLWNDTSAYWARLALDIDASAILEFGNYLRGQSLTYHRKIPTLSTCAVARKSLVGENEMLVATLDVRNASIRRPVGTSKVLITESRELATSQRESGEKVCKVPQRLRYRNKGRKNLTMSRIRPWKPLSSRTTLRVSMSMIRTTMSSQTTASKPLSRCSNIETAVDGSASVCSNFVVWKSKNYFKKM